MAGLVGLVDVFCMAQIYMHASVVTWQHVNTLVLFFGSVGIIGSACMAVGTRSQTTVRAAVVIITLLVLVRLVMQPVWLADITAMDNTVVTFPHAPLQMLEQLRTVHLLSLVRIRCGYAVLCCGRSESGAISHAAGKRIADCR